MVCRPNKTGVFDVLEEDDRTVGEGSEEDDESERVLAKKDDVL